MYEEPDENIEVENQDNIFYDIASSGEGFEKEPEYEVAYNENYLYEEPVSNQVLYNLAN